MAIFDSISEFLSPLSSLVDDVSGGVRDIMDSPLGRLGTAAARGVGSVNKAAQTRAEQARKLQREDLMPVGTNVEAGASQWGLQQYAQDPAVMEKYWQSILTQFLNPNATKGAK